MFGQKHFWPKTFSAETFFGRKMAQPKNVSVKKRTTDFFLFIAVEIVLGQKCFQSIFFHRKFVRPNNLLADFFSGENVFGRKIVRSKSFSSEKALSVSTEKQFRPKKLSTENVFDRKFVQPKKFSAEKLSAEKFPAKKFSAEICSVKIFFGRKLSWELILLGANIKEPALLIIEILK